MSEALRSELLGEVPPDLLSLDGGEVGETLPTLGRVGKRLPTGFVDDRGTLHREFELVPWTFEVEEALGALAERERDMPLVAYTSEIIGAGLASLGAIDVTKLRRSERRLLVRRLFLSDALYLYVWIRLGALGPEMTLKRVRCSACGRTIPEYAADLRTMEVKVHETVPSAVVELERGVLYAGERRTKFRLSPIRWALLEDHPDALLNAAKLKLATIQQGVVGLEGAPSEAIHLTAEHLRSMLPAEINRLVREIDRLGGGPVMEVRDVDPKCGREFRAPIPWTYDDFFAVSSP